MSTPNTSNQVTSEAAIKNSKKTIDRNIRTLMQEMEHENTLIPETPTGKLQRVLKIYRSIKPMLTVISTLPLIPSTWRAAVVMFNQALEALSLAGFGGGGEVTAEFKGGKDLV